MTNSEDIGDTEVLVSQTGSHWRVITDEVTIDRFAVDGATFYGAGDTGVYHLDMHGEWKQVSPAVPGKVLSLVVDRDRLYVATERRGMFHISLYVATERRGMFHISLEEENYAVSHR